MALLTLLTRSAARGMCRYARQPLPGAPPDAVDTLLSALRESIRQGENRGASAGSAGRDEL